MRRLLSLSSTKMLRMHSPKIGKRLGIGELMDVLYVCVVQYGGLWMCMQSTSHNIVIPLYSPLDFTRVCSHHSLSTHTGTLKCFAAQMLRSDL